MIAIVDYEMGNVGSIKNMLKKLGEQSVITNEKEVIARADGIILPGVGSFDVGIKNLKKRGLFSFIREQVLEEKKPVLGICLGMQLLTNGSEEGNESGLALIDADTLKFKEMGGLKIPHMGWNWVHKQKESSLFEDFDEVPRFYFVHSYYIRCNQPEDILGTAQYGSEFTCCFSKDNVFGVQFHPEKSHRYGMTLLKGFLSLTMQNA